MIGDHATTAALFTVLDHEHHSLEALLALLNQEQEAIRTLSFDGLTAVTQAKFKLLEEIRTLEDQRATLVMQLAVDWAVEAGDLTLRTIAERLVAVSKFSAAASPLLLCICCFLLAIDCIEAVPSRKSTRVCVSLAAAPVARIGT